jgi:integrase/recombinase XerD
VIALEDRLAGYLAVRRALGYRLVRAEKLLAQFIAWLNERGEQTITTASALAWATLPPATDTAWHAHRLSAVGGFAAHVHARTGSGP